jgi:MFS family permease
MSRFGDRKRLGLLAAIMGTVVAGLDSTVLSVALPAISKDLGGGLAGQQWVGNAYLLVLGSLILIGGSLGDLVGERRVFAMGVGGFGIVSLLCAVAPSGAPFPYREAELVEAVAFTVTERLGLDASDFLIPFVQLRG